MGQGWECPKCHTVYAPWVASCHCNVNKNPESWKKSPEQLLNEIEEKYNKPREKPFTKATEENWPGNVKDLYDQNHYPYPDE